MTLAKDGEEVYEMLKKRSWIFPYKQCGIAVSELAKKGYKIILGWVEFNEPLSGEKTTIPHYWNYHPETLEELDITGSQFNINLEEDKCRPKIGTWTPNQRPEIYREHKRDIDPRDVYY